MENRFFKINIPIIVTTVALLSYPIVSNGAEASGNLENLDSKIAQLNKTGTTLAEVTSVLGEPERYAWKDKTFTKTNLPDCVLLVYPKGVQVLLMKGTVEELRCDGDGPGGFTWRGQLHLGSTVEDVIKAVGQPKETVVAKPGPSLASDGVFYRDIDGQKGSGYYARADKKVRFFFSQNKVCALYLMTGNVGGSAEGRIRVESVAAIEPYMDVRFKNLESIDFSKNPKIAETLTFGSKTVWPKSLPIGIDPAKLMEKAKNPGLGIRQLHQQGITGKGVNVAIIDQPLSQNHPEFAGKIVAYQDIGCDSASSMHGPAVVSLLVGKKCGTAPDARLYYAAAPFWTGDSAYCAKALDWITEKNAALPQHQKIRLVSVSAAPSGPGSPFEKNLALWDAARLRAEKAGILVLDCTLNHSFIGSCYYDANDPENVAKCKPGFPGISKSMSGPERILVPSSPRTTADETNLGELGYQYCGRGGLSWSIPYCAGVMAMGWQVRPDLDGAQMRELLFKSAHKESANVLIINPPEFIRMVQSFKADK